MSFICTRGGTVVTASQAILSGIAPNGGLYVPAVFPVLPRDMLPALAGMSYPQRAAYVLSLLLDDYAYDELLQDTQAAYSHFDAHDVAPLAHLSNNLDILELFHGPTLAFKDMALQLLPRLMLSAAKKNGETRRIEILTATSGDTGKAALEGFRDVPGTGCTVFYPQGGVSRVQELQMTTTGGGNTHVIAVRGNFDDTQTGVKRLFTDRALVARMNERGCILSSANSINLGRLVPQVAYYVSAYVDMLKSGELRPREKFNVSVPTGNFGNILAAYYAKRMGVPIARLICASNRNNVLTEFINTGRYNAGRAFHKTISPSMDILISSNLERYLFELCDRDSVQVNEWMRSLSATGAFDVGQAYSEKMRETFSAYFTDDNGTRDAIALGWQRHHYLCDPHTAVGADAVLQHYHKTNELPRTLIVATASPFKFAPDVAGALNLSCADGQDAFACADKLAQLTCLPVPPQITSLKTLPVRHTQTCEKEGMEQALMQAVEK